MRSVVFAILLLVVSTAAQSAAQDVRHDDVAARTVGSDAQEPGLAPEPPAITRLVNWFDRQVNQGGGPKDGFYPELGNMITGSGWISAGPGYRHHLFDGRALVTASGAVSWKVYKMAQARFELLR